MKSRKKIICNNDWFCPPNCGCEWTASDAKRYVQYIEDRKKLQAEKELKNKKVKYVYRQKRLPRSN